MASLNLSPGLSAPFWSEVNSLTRSSFGQYEGLQRIDPAVHSGKKIHKLRGCSNDKTRAIMASAPQREKDPKKRIVITGVGLVSVFGSDVDTFYDKLLEGESGIGFIDRFDASSYSVRFAGQIHGFSANGYIDGKNDRRLDDCWRYGLVSGKMALENANLGHQQLEKKEWRTILLLAIWGIWKWRNGKIFSSRVETCSSLTASIIALYSALDISRKNSNGNGRNYDSTIYRYESGRRTMKMTASATPCAYFDGAARQGICACGVYIRTSNTQALEIYWNAGPGTNNRAEAGLLSFSNFLDIPNLQICGDSEVITDHVLSKQHIKNIHLAGWLDRIAALWNNRWDYSISHIDRNKNKKALSKMGLTSPQGLWRMQIKADSNIYQIQDFHFQGI